MKHITLILLFAFLIPLSLLAQESKLAQQYFNSGEYEKAATLYEKLMKSAPTHTHYFNKYLKCLTSLERYEEAEKILNKQIKKNPKNAELHIQMGNLYEMQFKKEEADQRFRDAIRLMPPNRTEVVRLANSFIKLAKYDLAIETYEKGNKTLKEKNTFSYQLGDVYRRKGEVPLMIKEYLNSLVDNAYRMPTIQTYFQRYLSTEDFGELKSQLYERAQESPNEVIYPEMLTWVFMHEKDFKNAFRQVKALDKRLAENGGRVYKLAQDAAREKDFESAIEAYNYIVEEKGKSCTFYLDAKRESLNCKKQLLVDGYQYTNEDLRQLESEYISFLDEFGRNKTTASIIRELARLEAFYINDLDSAIELLDLMIAYPGVGRTIKAEAKLDLGDFYLMKSEVWESTLLYSQVDKDFKDDMLGEVARYKNAKLAYYNGDFEWAQAQLNVLKASTSELISNDAIDLSVFIMDHYALDTTAGPMKMYALSDLLTFQNRFDASFAKLDSIKLIYPTHDLEDDILYAKAKIYYKQRDFEKNAEMLQQIIDGYPKSIRVDNALYELALLYEKQLDDTEKAKTLYQKLLLDHSGSTFTVDARKRFRALRGDGVQ